VSEWALSWYYGARVEMGRDGARERASYDGRKRGGGSLSLRSSLALLALSHKRREGAGKVKESMQKPV